MERKQETLNGQLNGVIDELVSRGITLQQARREFERMYVLAALRRYDGNLTRSAKELGVHRNTLSNKVAALRIASREYSRSAKRRS